MTGKEEAILIRLSESQQLFFQHSRTDAHNHKKRREEGPERDLAAVPL